MEQTMMTGRTIAAAAALALSLGMPAAAADMTALAGKWEGPWYRGMSSGKAVFEIQDNAGTIQLTNSETFGDEAKPLKKVEFDGKTLRFEVDGGAGPLAAALKLNDRGDQMKGMGRYEGFPLRFELLRSQ
jgi:hypothetical protein